MPLPDYLSELGGNQLFGAGTGLIGVGLALTGLKRSYGLISSIFRRKCLISIEVTSRDQAYTWVLDWLAAQGKGPTAATQHRSLLTSFSQGESGVMRTQYTLVPGPGDHYMFYDRRLIYIERHREQAFTDKPLETVKLTCLGRDPRFFLDILRGAHQLAASRMETGIVIYQAIGHEWREFGTPRRKRPLGSVVLDTGLAQRIYDDVSEFISEGNWYMERGVPYRRGYLLHGPPGCGKSSFISALASELGYSICILSLSERALTDDRLNHLLNTAPSQSIILLEDIDAAFVSREENESVKAAYDGLTRVTFSGLLNALDGVGSGEARIVFMTTNHPERLDPALIRPGRVDFDVYIGNCSDYQLAEMFSRFYPEIAPGLVHLFVDTIREKLNGKPVSPAFVQGYFLLFKNDPESAVEQLKTLDMGKVPVVNSG